MGRNLHIKVEQTSSPIRRHHSQRETLIGLGAQKNRAYRGGVGYAFVPRHDRQVQTALRKANAVRIIAPE
jgi:hypothetical protein